MRPLGAAQYRGLGQHGSVGASRLPPAVDRRSPRSYKGLTNERCVMATSTKRTTSSSSPTSSLPPDACFAERHEFALDRDTREAWERINRRPARTVAELGAMSDTPSPFTE